MEGGAMVSYSTGSMNSLVEKLAKLKNSRPMITGRTLLHDLVTLKKDFLDKLAGRGEMNLQGLLPDLMTLKKDFLDKLAGRRELNFQVRAWMKRVRKLVFDIEDWLNQKPENTSADLSERDEIEYFKIQIKEAIDLCTRYTLLDEADVGDAPPSRGITIDCRLLWGERRCLLALDRPKDEIRNHLMDGQEKLKVVSIVGTGGLGKTTLAMEVHGELQGQFECGAFVHIGQNPSVWTILVSMLHQIVYSYLREDDPHVTFEDEQDVIALLWKLLCTKRYFIILDGIWSVRTWRVINGALPDNNLGSRILIVTRMKDVAMSCSPRYTDVIYEMEPLSDDDSRRLFKRCVAEKEGLVDDYLLKMCGGMPLAIVLAASLLPCKSDELWHHVLLSLEHNYPKSPGMTKILHICYADLSIPVRSCLLYLTLFPEDYTIKKDRLIRLWIAEGFIPRIDDERLWVTGERYFNELIMRRLIHPVFDCHDDQAMGCTVQAVVLDFIRTLSRLENFTTTAEELSSGPFPCDTIRRFSLDWSNQDEVAILESSTEQLSSIRSLNSQNVKAMPNPFIPSHSDLYMDLDLNFLEVVDSAFLTLRFKLRLRVLDLEDVEISSSNLEWIGELFLLRYLGLAGTGVTYLPEGILLLKQLETLDLRRNRYIHIAREVGRRKLAFPKMVHLLCDMGFPELSDIPPMQELEEVSTVQIDLTSWSLAYLKNLLIESRRLRILRISLGRDREMKTYLEAFLEELAMSNLHSLSLHCGDYDDETACFLVDSWIKVNSRPYTAFKPGRFELIISDKFYYNFLKEVPPHMDSLGYLTHLHICLQQIGQKDLGILRNMDHLVLLNLSSRYAADDGRCIIEKGFFERLVVLSFTCPSDGMGLQFKQGAMPQLRRLALSIRVRNRYSLSATGVGKHGDFDFGMENLTCLTQVHLTLNRYVNTISEVKAAEADVREKLSACTNKPKLELCTVYNRMI